MRLSASCGVAVLVGVLLVDCGGGATAPQPDTTTGGRPVTSSSRPSHLPGGTGTEIDAGLAPYVDLARADLAGRLEVSPDQIVVVTATVVIWPDTSMGCPKPGMSYAQVGTDGSLIELRLGTKIYRYHSGNDVKPFLCPS